MKSWSWRRFYRLIPRFSVSNLLMLMVVVGLCLAWYDQRRKSDEQAASFQRKLADRDDVIEHQRLQIRRLTVNGIVRSDLSDGDKAKVLSPYITVGSNRADTEKWLGPQESWMVWGKRETAKYSDCDLVVEYDFGDTVRAFGYDRYYRTETGVRSGSYVLLARAEQ